MFVKGGTSGVAMAEMQRVLVDMAGKHGMVVERTRPLPNDTRQGLAALRMEVNASGSIEALRGYLHQIETGTPLIFVNQVHIAPGPAVPDGDISDNLSVRLEVEGFAWWENAS
jgi:general secretion pathway protein M